LGATHCPNASRPHCWRLFFISLKPLDLYLLIAGAIALLTGDVKDAVFILVVILMNATIGTTQEWRAEQSAHALQKMLKVNARVLRNGQQISIGVEELVPAMCAA
jgi:magnesium-transporting ATPase (P-type)